MKPDLIRQSWPKRQPRRPKPKNSGESRTRVLLAARSGGRCEMCGAARAESVHHRRKKSQGGPWSASNCVHVCGDGTRGCHGWAEANPSAAAVVGFHLRPGDIPAQVPVVSRLHGRVWLSDDGTVTPVEGSAA